MKIVDRKTFLEMPPGTVFAMYEPCCFSGLFVKLQSLFYAETNANDFVCQGLGIEIENHGSDDFIDKCAQAEKGMEVKLDFNSPGRDGMYDEDQLFAVFSKEDVQKLIDRLKECL